MKKLFEIADRYVAESNWRVLALLKFCLFAMGLMAGTLCLRAKKAWLRIGWMALAEILMVGGYFLFECALYGAGAAAGSLPGNLFQGAAGLLVGAAPWPLIQRTTRLLK